MIQPWIELTLQFPAAVTAVVASRILKIWNAADIVADQSASPIFNATLANSATTYAFKVRYGTLLHVELYDVSITGAQSAKAVLDFAAVDAFCVPKTPTPIEVVLAEEESGSSSSSSYTQSSLSTQSSQSSSSQSSGSSSSQSSKSSSSQSSKSSSSQSSESSSSQSSKSSSSQSSSSQSSLSSSSQSSTSHSNTSQSESSKSGV